MIFDGLQIQIFHFFSCPGCPAQKFQARFNAGVFSETIYPDTVAQFFPTVKTYQVNHYRFEGFAM